MRIRRKFLVSLIDFKPNSLVTRKCPLLLALCNNLFVNHEAFAFPYVLYQRLCWVLRQYVSFAVLLEFFFCLRDKEWVVLIYLESIEHKLRIGNPLALLAERVAKFE